MRILHKSCSKNVFFLTALVDMMKKRAYNVFEVIHMYRQKMEQLKKWKQSELRKPLIIRGARQVGKTWLMKEFGQQYYESVAYINFDSNERMERLFRRRYGRRKNN